MVAMDDGGGQGLVKVTRAGEGDQGWWRWKGLEVVARDGPGGHGLEVVAVG